MEERSHICLCTVDPYNMLSLHRDTVQAEFICVGVNRCVRTGTQTGLKFGLLRNRLFHRKIVMRKLDHMTSFLHVHGSVHHQSKNYKIK
jgi:hypothetical protein